MLGKLEEMGDRATGYFGPGHSISIFLKFYCIVFLTTAQTLSWTYSLMGWKGSNTGMFECIRCFRAPCHSSPTSKLIAELSEASCLLGDPKGNNTGGMLGTMRQQTVKGKTQHTSPISEFRTNVVSLLPLTLQLLMTAAAPTHGFLCLHLASIQS